MRITVNKSTDNFPAAEHISREIEIFLSPVEARALLAKNVEIRAWLKPTLTGSVLLADSGQLRKLGFADFGAHVDAELHLADLRIRR